MGINRPTGDMYKAQHHYFLYSLWKGAILLLALQVLVPIVAQAILADVESVPGDALGDDRHGTGVWKILLTRAAFVNVVFEHVSFEVARVCPRRITQRTFIRLLPCVSAHVLLEVTYNGRDVCRKQEMCAVRKEKFLKIFVVAICLKKCKL